MAVGPEELRGVLARYASVLQAAPLPIVVLDRTARVQFWNPAAERLLGWTADEVVGRSAPGIPEESRAVFEAQFVAVLRGETVVGLEAPRLTKSGEALQIHLAASPLRNDAGEVIGVVRTFEDVTDRRRIEAALREQAALLDLTFDAILVRDYATDAITYWNRGAEEMYGFPRAAVIGRVSHDVLQTIHPIPLDRTREILRRTGRWDGELVHVTSDGRQIVVASRWALQMDRGEPVAILESNTDITERKQSEENVSFLAEAGAMLASSLDYEMTLASTARLVVPRIADWCGVHIVDVDGSVRQVAAAHVDPVKVDLARDLDRRYPFDPTAAGGLAEVLRTGRPDLTPEIDDELLAQSIPDPELLAIMRELGLRSSMIVPLIARDRILGAITFVSAESGRRFGPEDVRFAQQLAGRAALAVDNARLYREAQRRAAEQSAIVAQLADGVVIADAEEAIVFSNAAARRLLGGSRTGLTVSSAIEAYRITTIDGEPYPPSRFPLYRALRQGETLVDEAWRMRRFDGSEIVLEGSAAPIVTGQGDVSGAVLTFHDITAQRDLARQKDEFLSTIAHDLRTPLTTIKGLAQILLRRLGRGHPADPTKLIDGLQRIDETSARMAALIDELLDLTRVQMGRSLDLNRRPLDLVALLRRQVEMQDAVNPRHHIVFKTSLPALTGMWDGERIERVFANLLSNAVKYSPDGGEVTVHLHLDEGGRSASPSSR